MKLGIFGGSFDPIHTGHLCAALRFKNLMKLDLILLLPAFEPFYKKTCHTAYGHRLAMCQLAVKNMDGIEVSDLEQNMPPKAFTCDVVREIAARHPGHELFLLLGSDAFARMPRWTHVDEIIRTAVIVAFRRRQAKECSDACRNAEQELRQRGGDIRILDAPMLPISSSMIRAKAARGESIREFVCPSVVRHIERYGLYPEHPESAACELSAKTNIAPHSLDVP